ncbi:hypothetical protein MGA5115_02061 [Marinomonas gallaica]|uniref:Uncharacterized protein n=1 Tax=Marinomonas gallaica TaxID=1806667 RepID=A0A1C3JRV4_9GAMM|nr:hypothetical protein [Marinomonas gallaica]SBT17944.1 hypothetical protein MGA5115_02061 [Marinomonas gallaica]SBT20757.1 hypothetical protein MGA5116_01344 [Marinomonas gallaica]
MNFKTPALIAALTLTASASFASGDENNLLDNYLDAQAHAQAISAQLETMGVESNPNIEFNSPTTLSQKLDAYEDKIDELQNQFDTVRSAN